MCINSVAGILLSHRVFASYVKAINEVTKSGSPFNWGCHSGSVCNDNGYTCDIYNALIRSQFKCPDYMQRLEQESCNGNCVVFNRILLARFLRIHRCQSMVLWIKSSVWMTVMYLDSIVICFETKSLCIWSPSDILRF